MARLTKKLAKQFLSNCAPEHCFWCRDGRILCNLRELAEALESMSGETFSYHANKEKNDFAKWVEDIFHDSALASELRRARKASGAARRVKARIAELEKLAK
ncbi:hypothetical protein D6817_02405 [Candidatus Pacearchaeota archaeon]|nr:MAG: hypothetical protein D6817_02405 [Candidatus Pacearchaeota archaeon]